MGRFAWAGSRGPVRVHRLAAVHHVGVDVADVLTAFSVVFLAELGDKTRLTTAGLAADRGAASVWVGSFGAMLAATALAVLAGQSLMKRVRPGTLRRAGAVAFAVVGTVTLVGAIAG